MFSIFFMLETSGIHKLFVTDIIISATFSHTSKTKTSVTVKKKFPFHTFISNTILKVVPRTRFFHILVFFFW